MCNGTDTADGCDNQGCTLGISLCQETDVCQLWYGQCFGGGNEDDLGRCWSCMSVMQDECLDCTPGYSIQQPKPLNRLVDSDVPWAKTRGSIDKQPLPKWSAPHSALNPTSKT